MATEQNKAVDYQEQLLEAIRIVAEKQVKSVSFDKTIEAIITDASRASDGVYVVSTGDAKFDAYSTETNYKNNDAVMVTIPQGDYSKQKIIVGKQVGNSKTPLIYKSPFQQFINVSGNLIQSSGNYFASYYANKDDGRLGRCWPIDVNFEQSSCATEIYTYRDNENITVEIPCGQIWDSGNMQEQGYARLGLSAEFSTWLNEYDIINGNYGLVLKVTFKCVDLEDQQNNTFDKYLIFDSDEFFGDGLNFETYYLQEKLFDIEEYAQYQIVHMTLYSYQRSNFTTLDGAYGLGIYGEETLPNDEEDFSIVQPNIFVKSPMICLGTPLEDFDTDTAEIICDGKLTYYKTKDDPSADRNAANKKELSLRWIHKDAKADIIAVVDPDTLPQDYEVRWYRYTLGSPSPDQFAGAHWKRFYGCADSVNEDNGEWAIEEIESPEEDLATNTLKELIFQPNVNKQEEKIKAIILKNENPNGNAIFRLVAVSNIITFTNDNEVRNKQTVIDTNALSIRYDDDERGHYFLYNEAGDIGKKEDTEVRILTAVFDENVNDVYEKAVLQVAECSEITWTFPDGNTMIVPMDAPSEDAKPANETIFRNVNQVGFTIKSHLDNNATQNTIQLDIVKDGLNYTAQIQPIFGTAGDNGSDYKLILTWQDGKNALNLSESFDHSLIGDVILYDQAGDAVDWPADAELEANWLVAEFGDTEIREKEVETADYYYPILANNNALIGIDDNPEAAYQGNGYYYFIPDSDTSDYVYFNAEDEQFDSIGDTIPYRKCRENESKNKLEFRKITFTEDPLDPETGEYKSNYFSNHPNPIVYNTTSNKKEYYYSEAKKFFIKIKDQYILDPWQDYQEVETYYEPIEAKEKVYTLQGSDIVGGLKVSIPPDNKHQIIIRANESVSMDSLFILQLTLKNFGDYDLVSYYPIALKNGETKDTNDQNTKVIQYIEGPDRVRYSSAGETDFNKNPYQITVLKYENGNMVKYRHGYNDSLNNLEGYWKLLFIEKDENNNEDNFKPVLKETAIDAETHQIKVVDNGEYDIPLLSPISVYIPDALPYGVQFVDTSGSSEQIIWTQPILVYENKYPSATLNKWNGKDIETDQDAGTITASGFAAGKKERDNTFTGVVLGDWSRSVADTAITKNTGVYGFNHGAMAYAFKDDGTGFIGKDGKGRIFLDGDKSQIFSSNWANKDTPQGMLLDIDDGFIKMQSVDTENDVYTKITNNVKDRYFSWVDGYIIKDDITLYKHTGDTWTEINSSMIISPGDEVSEQADGASPFILSSDRENEHYILYNFNENKKDTLNPLYENRLYTNPSGEVDYLVALNSRYNSAVTYYLKESGTRYITLGSNQPHTPLSIGTEKNVAQRRFRVDWDGTLHVIDGDFKGDISGSTISGSAVYASYLEAYNGKIGGWYIGYNQLYSGNTILSSYDGITTNVIHLVDGTYNAQLGFCPGNNRNKILGIKSNTFNLAIEATAGTIPLDSVIDGSYIRLTASAGIQLEAAGSVLIGQADDDRVTSYTNSSFLNHKPKVYIYATELRVNTPSPEDQYGIYARFAPDPPAS